MFKTLSRIVSSMALLLLCGNLHAASLYYTFSANLQTFQNFGSDFTAADFPGVIGPQRTYVVEVDFNRDVHYDSNDNGDAWQFFYSNTLRGDLFTTAAPTYQGYNIAPFFRRQGHLYSGSANIWTSEWETNAWRVQDWVVGQTLQIAESHYFPSRGGTVYFFGNAKLLSISSVNPVPVPAAAWLFGSALAGLAGWSRRRAMTAQDRLRAV